MKSSLLQRLLAGMALSVALPAFAATYTLYDGVLGTTPGSQGWISSLPSGAIQTMGGGAVTLDSSSSNSVQAGYSLLGGLLPESLDSTAGFALSFDMSLSYESHASGNRAGFSVILLDSTDRGVEIGFWSDSFWAQSTSFTRAESAAFDVGGGMSHFDLVFHGAGYTLTASRAGTSDAVLSGSLRQYPASFLTPYGIPNFLFLGDDTTSAAATVSLAEVTLSTVPEPAVPALLGAGLLALVLPRRRPG